MLDTLACDIGASECHGMLCGMLCGPGGFDTRVWLRHVSGGDDIAAYEGRAAYAVFEDMQVQTRGALEDGEFEFAPLLPDADTALSDRAVSFAGWCRGFLSGFGLSGVTDLSILGEDARGFLRDLERFGALDVGQQSDEEDERALLELTEFARMGVLIVHAEACVEHAEPPPYYH